MLEKLGGFAAIVVTVTMICLISIFNPNTFIQFLSGLIGSFFCLIGIVFLFAEGQLLTNDHWLRKRWTTATNRRQR